MKLWEKSVLLGLILTVLFTMTGFVGQCENISEKVLRLHILANSDSDEDQALKLKVRDRLLSCSAGLLDGVEDRLEAERVTRDQLAFFQQEAQDEIYNQGYDYPVQVELTRMYFNTREYDTVTLPAGTYDALRVTIGAAEGHNWWCVMFPPMCLPAAEESRELGDVLNEEEMEIVQGQGYEVRFKIVEIFENVCDWFQRLGGGQEQPVVEAD
jgi:stage II sporulation protein R